MSVATLLGVIPAGDRMLLDTTTLAAYLDGSEIAHPVARHVMEDLVASGRNPAIVSMITVMELLVRPLRASPPGHHTILSFIRNHPNLVAMPVDLQVAQDAAFLRAASRLSPPDALVVGTGLAGQVGHLVTNDRKWSAKLVSMSDRVRVVTLSDHLPFP
ncbi:MAG: PIN domain-containing protein [Chloroflexi bacterium]|nr:PIN domain-containing protein [Chloroflexota bacterium]